MKDLNFDPETYREMVEGNQGEILDILFTRKKLLEKYPKFLPNSDEITDEYYTIRGGDLYLRERLGLKIDREFHGNTSLYLEIHSIPLEFMPLFMYAHWGLAYNGIVIDDFQMIMKQISEIYGYEETPEESTLMAGSFWMDHDELGNWYATFDEG